MQAIVGHGNTAIIIIIIIIIMIMIIMIWGIIKDVICMLIGRCRVWDPTTGVAN